MMRSKLFLLYILSHVAALSPLFAASVRDTLGDDPTPQRTHASLGASTWKRSSTVFYKGIRKKI